MHAALIYPRLIQRDIYLPYLDTNVSYIYKLKLVHLMIVIKIINISITSGRILIINYVHTAQQFFLDQKALHVFFQKIVPLIKDHVMRIKTTFNITILASLNYADIEAIETASLYHYYNMAL
jgi:hypothetical protein